MPGLAVREFECILCDRRFTLLRQDFILPWTLICDECLVEIWALEEDALAEYLAAARPVEGDADRLKPTGSPARPHPYEREIASHVRELKGRRATVQETIRHRGLERGTFGQAGTGAS